MSTESAFVNWTNRSVLQFARGSDPLTKISQQTEDLVLKAFEQGWSGPPYDPFKLAELLRISVVPRDDVAEARTVQDSRGGILIEFNPRQPSARIRFSIAHEITHTFFPDCLERARYRAKRTVYRDDDWQLEMLCNIGAAEILMPPGSFVSLRNAGFDIARLMDLRRELEVSAEALLIRIVKLAKVPLGCFVASWRSDSLRVDYSVFSNAWAAVPPKGIRLPEGSSAEQCAAIGHIAKGTETWNVDGKRQEVAVQAVGLPAYQGADKVRIAGLFRPKVLHADAGADIAYLVGNALEPTGEGRKVIAHVVNDQTPRWGGSGFAASVKKVWPEIQDDFKDWAWQHKDKFKLGAVRIGEFSDEISIMSMVAQHGYGPSDRPRIRYGSLEKCLHELADYATKEQRSVHMPKIGTGYGLGNWGLIEELIEEKLCARGIKVNVYQLSR
jgi:hypothetical protein